MQKPRSQRVVCVCITFLLSSMNKDEFYQIQIILVLQILFYAIAQCLDSAFPSSFQVDRVQTLTTFTESLFNICK